MQTAFGRPIGKAISLTADQSFAKKAKFISHFNFGYSTKPNSKGKGKGKGKGKLKGKGSASQRFSAQRGRFDASEHPRDEFGRFIGTGGKKSEQSKHWKTQPREIGHAAGLKPSGKTFTIYDLEAQNKDHLWSSIEGRLRSSSVKGGGLKTFKVKGLKVSERQAIDEYTGDSDLINKMLRRGKPVKLEPKPTKPKRADFKNEDRYYDASDDWYENVDDWEEKSRSATTIAGLDSVLRRTKLSEGVVAYRSFGGPAWTELMRTAKPGKSYRDKGFVSTSLSRDFAEGFGGGHGGMLAIRIPKGSSALPLHNWTSIDGERELLIARGARFKVLRVAKREIVVTLVGTGSRSQVIKRGNGNTFTKAEQALDAFGTCLAEFRALIEKKKGRPKRPTGTRLGSKFKEHEHPRDAQGHFKDKPGVPKKPVFRPGHGKAPKVEYETLPKPVVPRGGVMEIEPQNSPFKPTIKPSIKPQDKPALKPMLDDDGLPSAAAMDYNMSKPVPNESGFLVIYEGHPKFKQFSPAVKEDILGLKYHYNTPSGLLPGAKVQGWDDELGIPQSSFHSVSAVPPTTNSSVALTGTSPKPAPISHHDKGGIGTHDEFGHRIGTSAWTGNPKNIGLATNANKKVRGEFTIHQYGVSNDYHDVADDLWAKSLKGTATAQHKVAVRRYTTSEYRQVNARLRKTGMGHNADQPLTAQHKASAKEITEGLDSFFDNVSLAEGLVAYRGLGGEGWRKMMDANMKPGKVFTDLGFVSTSMNQRFSQDWVNQHAGGGLIAIRIPKGMKAIPLGTRSSLPRENELLIARGAKFRVIKFSPQDRRIVLQLLKTGSKSSKTIKYVWL